MEKIILASNNKNKIKEFKQIFKNYEILPMEDVGFKDEIVEDGKTFEENATIKANAIYQFLKRKNIRAGVLADDSGLCVNALNGAPGVYSARFSGIHGDNKANRERLLKEMEGITDRSAFFVCCLVYMDKDGRKWVAEGKTYGEILEKEVGTSGFGYDPVFLSSDLKKSFASASADEKNAVSHRGRAIKNLLEKLKIKGDT